MAHFNIDAAKQNPANFFKKPEDVVYEPTLTYDQKVDILKRWAYDEREKAVAEEENMPNQIYDHEKHSMLSDIMKALIQLDKQPH